MNFKIICYLSLISMPLYGMESGNFEAYLATAEVIQEMEAFTAFLKGERKVAESTWEDCKAVALIGMKSTYDQLHTLKKQQLITQEKDCLLLKPTAHHSFIAAILQQTLTPSLSNVLTLNDWDAYFVFGVGIVYATHKITIESNEAEALIEQFCKDHPDRSGLCDFLQRFLGDGCLRSSDPCFE